MFLILVSILIALIIYKFVIKPRSYWKERNVPSLPYWPFVGHLGQYVLRQKPMPYLCQDWYKNCKSRYQGIFQFTKPSLMIKDLELIKNIYIKDFDSFIDHQIMVSEEIDPLVGKTLFVLRGQRWKDMRSILSPAFTGSKMRFMFTLMRDSAEQFTNHFAQNSDGEQINLEFKSTYARFATDVIASVAFGVQTDSLKEKNNEFYVKGKELANMGGIRAYIFVGYMFIPKIMEFFSIRLFGEKISNYFRNLVLGNMKIREEKGILRNDYIHLLMEARKGKLKHDSVLDEDAGFATVTESAIGKSEPTKVLSEDDVTAQALVFFVAGFDTISTVSSFISYELALNPDVQKKLQSEIDATQKECNGKVTYEALLKMKYLDMVISENLRLWSPASTTDRLCVKPYTIQPTEPGEEPIHLKKNDTVFVSIFGIHRDPQYYENPEKFDPERFNDENKKNIQPMSYIPFGLGPRNCIGSRFALLEIKVLLFHLLSKFDIVVNEKTQIPIKLSKSHFDVNAADGFFLGLKLRKNKVL